MKRHYYILFISILFSSCSVYDGPEKIIWVFPYMLNGPILSQAEEGIFFFISDSPTLNYSPDAWMRKTEDFEIKGFNFERGYFQKLVVETQDKKSNQEVKWRVKTVLEKRKNFVENIRGSWVSTPTPDYAYAYVELGISEISRTATIYIPCIIISSVIGEIDEKNVELIGYSGSMINLCGKPAPWDPQPTGPNGLSILNQATQYKITADGFLDFFDAQGNFLIRFKSSE